MASNSPPLLASKLTLPNGQSIPQIQLGLYLMSRSEASHAVAAGLALGYRGFDCAQMYRNEREAGQAMMKFLANTQSLRRQDLSYTSKLAENSKSYDVVRRSINKSVETCGLGYIDLFLLHSPYGGREARLMSWKALEDAVLEGDVRMAGVSNYGVKHIEELMASNPRVKPVINQIEVHPFNTQVEIREVCRKHDIVIEAYAPLARAMRMAHPTITDLAAKYSCTPAQIFVKWSLQRGFVTLPKSTKEERMAENASVEGLTITNEDMDVLDGLDEDLVTDWDPTDAA